jgi:EAL domain-containing protein (putative c-di-GMP-specific phosphodiesterase class I)
VASWPGADHLGVNISPKQIILPALPEHRQPGAVARTSCPGNRIELEVTEGVFLGGRETPALDVLKRLRALGVGIALDDFGTGYSSIGYLNKAVVPQTEDRRQFRPRGRHPSRERRHHPVDRQLAKSFRMNVTAEGVETAEDFERMRDLGVDTIQGYLFGRPLSYERAQPDGHRPRQPAEAG